LKEEALDRTMWRAGYGRGFGPVVRQTTKWMNICHVTLWRFRIFVRIFAQITLSAGSVLTPNFQPAKRNYVSNLINLYILITRKANTILFPSYFIIYGISGIRR